MVDKMISDPPRPSKPDPLLLLAFLTASACSIHIVEGLFMRLLPLPFLRIGLSNVVVMYLVLRGDFWPAFLVNFTKSVVGGLATFTLLTPTTLLSLGGGLAAVLAMWLAHKSRAGFSLYGISVCGAVAHLLVQLLLVRWVVLNTRSVFVLTPILLLIALISGILTAWVFSQASARFQTKKTV